MLRCHRKTTVPATTAVAVLRQHPPAATAGLIAGLCNMFEENMLNYVVINITGRIPRYCIIVENMASVRIVYVNNY